MNASVVVLRGNKYDQICFRIEPASAKSDRLNCTRNWTLRRICVLNSGVEHSCVCITSNASVIYLIGAVIQQGYPELDAVVWPRGGKRTL
jgi:hypothetical protein